MSTTTTKRADELVVGDRTATGRVTAPWRQYKRDARGWGSVAIDGKRVKMFRADSVAIEAPHSADCWCGGTGVRRDLMGKPRCSMGRA